MSALKKVLDSTPKRVYNIRRKDGEGFDLSSISEMSPLADTLYTYYKRVRETYEANTDLFPTPPVFAGGFFRDILWDNFWPADLDLFFNSHGMDPNEAEDNLCLFLHKLGLEYQEVKNEEYAGLNSMRVFNCVGIPGTRAYLQAILKDCGPPSKDPLYVTEDFHYNHGKAVLSVVGEPEIHYHGHAVAGHLHKIHAAYGEKGMKKCKDKFYGYRDFKQIDFSVPSQPIKPKSEVKMPNSMIDVKYWNSRDFQDILKQQTFRIKVRNEFVQQFVPNNRRPVP